VAVAEGRGTRLGAGATRLTLAQLQDRQMERLTTSAAGVSPASGG